MQSFTSIVSNFHFEIFNSLFDICVDGLMQFVKRKINCKFLTLITFTARRQMCRKGTNEKPGYIFCPLLQVATDTADVNV